MGTTHILYLMYTADSNRSYTTRSKILEIATGHGIVRSLKQQLLSWFPLALFKLPPQPPKTDKAWGDTPLQRAVVALHSSDIVEELLACPRVDVNARSDGPWASTTRVGCWVEGCWPDCGPCLNTRIHVVAAPSFFNLAQAP